MNNIQFQWSKALLLFLVGAVCVIAFVIWDAYRKARPNPLPVASITQQSTVDAIEVADREKQKAPSAPSTPSQQSIQSRPITSKIEDSLSLQIEKDGYNKKLLDRFVKYGTELIVAIEQREADKGAAEEAMALAARLGELRLIANEPLPYVTANVPGPPGTARWPGMAPELIKDPERRKAYEAALRENVVNNEKRGWLIGANASQSGLVAHLSAALSRMQDAGFLSTEKRKEILLAAKGALP